MADAAPSFASPVRGAAMGSADSVLLEDLTGARLTLVTGRGAVPPPVEVGFAARRGEAVVLSVSPSEVLLIGEEAVGVDVTHARILYRLTGPASALALERVCALDFDDRFMPEGAAGGTSVAKVVCELARLDRDGSPSYLLSAGRSFGAYLWDALVDAAAEFFDGAR